MTKKEGLRASGYLREVARRAMLAEIERQEPRYPRPPVRHGWDEEMDDRRQAEWSRVVRRLQHKWEQKKVRLIAGMVRKK